MIKKIVIQTSSLDLFVQKIKESLANRELGKIIDFAVESDKLKIYFSKLSKSEIVYLCTKTHDGFSLTHAEESIAFLHKPLRNEIEKKLANVIEQLGAQVELS